MSKTIELLSEQHREVLVFLAEAEAALERGTADAGAFLRYLNGDVAVHFALEETALFPLLARHAELARGPVAVMEKEHATFRQLVERCGEASEKGDERGLAVASLAIIDLLRLHIAKEDRVLFPLALRTLSAPERAELEERASAAVSGQATRGERTVSPVAGQPRPAGWCDSRDL